MLRFFPWIKSRVQNDRFEDERGFGDNMASLGRLFNQDCFTEIAFKA
jgi:hypothetical protein